MVEVTFERLKETTNYVAFREVTEDGETPITVGLHLHKEVLEAAGLIDANVVTGTFTVVS